jgi:Mg/Co/Ni transporter MgtE
VDDDSDGDDADGNSAAVAVRPQQGLKKRQSLWGPVAAVTVSLVVIVAAAAPIGAVVPLLFARVGLDPEHAAPAVQVLMDVLGAVITCGTFSALLG